MQSSTEVRRFAASASAECVNPMPVLPPQAIFDDLVFDVPSWGEARIENEEVGLGLLVVIAGAAERRAQPRQATHGD